MIRQADNRINHRWFSWMSQGLCWILGIVLLSVVLASPFCLGFGSRLLEKELIFVETYVKSKFFIESGLMSGSSYTSTGT